MTDERVLDRLCRIASDKRRRNGMITETGIRTVAREHAIEPDVLVEHARTRGWIR